MATGIEMLITTLVKSLKLDNELAAVRQLVASGQLDKIVRFADQLDELNENIKALRDDVRELKAGRDDMRELKSGSGATDCGRDDLVIRSIAYLNGGS